MNTVMDDNKMLTLASNERIPLTPSMRLLLEINHMKHCSPATVSRGGVIYVNADDIGWRPARPRLCLPACCMPSTPTQAAQTGGGAAQAVDSWLAGLEASEFRPLLAVLFERYVEATMEHCRRNFRAVVPLPAVSQAATVCQILGSLLPKARAARGPACTAPPARAPAITPNSMHGSTW